MKDKQLRKNMNLKVYVFEPKVNVIFKRESYYFLAKNRRHAWKMFLEDQNIDSSFEKQEFREDYDIFCYCSPGKFEEIIEKKIK